MTKDELRHKIGRMSEECEALFEASKEHYGAFEPVRDELRTASAKLAAAYRVAVLDRNRETS